MTGPSRARGTTPFLRHASILLLLSATSPATGAPIACTATPGLAVDADGAPDSYRVDGKGLSATCDGVFAVVDGVAHTQKNDRPNWQALCARHWDEARRTGNYAGVRIVGFLSDAAGRPVVQGAGDPLPGQAFVTTTSLTIPGTPDSAQRHYVDAREIPYVVLSPAYARASRLRLGDLVAVYRPRTGRLAYAVYADCCSNGEASVRLHQDLGSDPIVVAADGAPRARRGLADRIVLAPLPGAHPAPTLDAAAWRAAIAADGETALHTLGGPDALRACAGSPLAGGVR
ncbi:MAG: hypothetical protein INR65_20865 [Gluconacetobacter diazotrophicus]|nr:hypothetical protein [Gluconacetobacter diazotrophicus]